MELFKGIDFNDSFVLNWKYEENTLSINLEVSVWPESSHYSEPKDGEYTCYKKATLMFENVKSISGLKPIESVPSTTDPDGSTDYGNIETLYQTESGFNLSGDFGVVEINGGELHLEVHT